MISEEEKIEQTMREDHADPWPSHASRLSWWEWMTAGALFVAVAWILFGRCQAEEYSFAPGTPSSFRALVIKVMRDRPKSEGWIKGPTIKFWNPAPGITFQTVRAAFIEPKIPWIGIELPPVQGEIYRNGNIASWLFYSGSRDFITTSIGIRTSRADMISDLNFEIDLWLRNKNNL